MLFRISTLIAFFFSSIVNAQTPDKNFQCHQQKYQAYHQASNQWYQTLTQEAVNQQPNLTRSANAFLQQHQQLSVLNEAAFAWLWENQPQNLALKQSVEGWLTLNQTQIKQFSRHSHPLTHVAMPVYQSRQKSADKRQYALRKQFANTFKSPFRLQSQLDAYNRIIAHINAIDCEKIVKVNYGG